ncbi:hypothetical protein DEU32_10973 [Curtobacterium sp. AG1037]|uniref:hypothetical protein n=1 Tax=Curtobacterium sp. AG1037 TaxID=2183990 RepID=UPI000E0AAAA1|nr:hypothetical protein [Curtobacterium sp. AG1037]RDH96460.1 hypothetical protein DEU32_10973 [Curtobacterium sp. AG1037]
MTSTGDDEPTTSERDHPTSARDQALRALLVRTVEQPSRRRRWRAGAIGGAVLSALAGGLVGGAVTAAAAPDPEAAAAQAGARAAVLGATQPSMHVVGEPRGVIGTGDGALRVGSVPTGAELLVWSLRCRSDGGSTSVGPASSRTSATCTTGRTINGSVRVADVEGADLTVRTDGGTAWTLSVGWVRTPPMPGPSAAQQYELADGVVTRSEYLAAFHRFQGCMTARGDSLGVVPESSLFVAYGVDDQDAGDRCGRAEFDEVSAAWQAEHPAPADDDGTWGAQPYDPAADPRYAG